MKRIALSQACCTVNPSKNTVLFVATILNQTIVCSCTFFLEAKHYWSLDDDNDDDMSQLAPFITIAW